MSTHPMVDQLRFTRVEFLRAIEGVSDEDARRRFLPMNCMAWNVGHLAWQEQRYCLIFAQGRLLRPDVQREFAYGAPATTPSLQAMVAAWKEITRAADPWLDSLTPERLQSAVDQNGAPAGAYFGNLLQRLIYHYWYHLGENMAIRQQLGHSPLPTFVGDLDELAPYRPESMPDRSA